jgi:hypothetical protein
LALHLGALRARNAEAFASRDLFLDLSAYVAANPDFSDFAPSLIDQAKYKGQQIYIPIGWNNIMINYNRDLFDKAGVKYPVDWTWDEFRAAAKTLTVKDGDNLAERFRHLHESQRALWMRKHRGRGCVLDGVAGAVWSYEVKRGAGSGLWHPHLHMIALAEVEPSQERLSREWHAVTGDSHVVDVRPISQEDPASGFIEVFKYAVKASDMELADTVHAHQTLRGKRLIASAGCFRGVEVPEELTDEPLEGLPFVELLFRHLGGQYRPINRATR